MCLSPALIASLQSLISQANSGLRHHRRRAQPVGVLTRAGDAGYALSTQVVLEVQQHLNVGVRPEEQWGPAGRAEPTGKHQGQDEDGGEEPCEEDVREMVPMKVLRLAPHPDRTSVSVENSGRETAPPEAGKATGMWSRWGLGYKLQDDTLPRRLASVSEPRTVPGKLAVLFDCNRSDEPLMVVVAPHTCQAFGRALAKPRPLHTSHPL